ncbi:hypothetical protein B0H13DRAFT_1880803 [Mycena leptocephala]|nr:hypothetical protein B0H13DRAFT_1880803 [Mycena leptocephala]
MSADGTRNSKHTADEQLFIDRVSARRLMDFCTYYFLETPATYDPNAASTRTDLSAADRRLLDIISIRELTAFRNHVHTPHFIVSHSPRFLDHCGVDVTLLRDFLRASPAYPPSNPVHVKIEANPPLVAPLRYSPFSFDPYFDTHYDFAFFNAPITAADSDPLQSLVNSFGTHGTPLADSFWLSSTPNVDNSSQSPFAFPTHPGNEELPSFSVPIAVGVDAWPTLPPPQLDLLSSSPMTDVGSTATAKARSHREPEVDSANGT